MNNKNIFVINTGSASKKYALYRGDKRMFFAHFETEGAGFIATIDCGGSTRRVIPKNDFNNSLEYVLKELAEVRRLLKGIKIVGVSDSVFHATLPVHAYTYAIQHDVAEKFGIRKFGYHGSSFASVTRKVEAMRGGMPARMIICHLGSG